MAGTKRRSTRQASNRSIYAEPDTDDDDFEFEYSRQRSHEDDEYQSEQAPPAPKRQKTATRSKPQTRSKSTQQTLKSAFRVGKPRKANSKSNKHGSHQQKEEAQVFKGLSDRKIPNWTSLPIDILRDIFIFATLPPENNNSFEPSNVSWLLRVARMNRAFAQPALEAFYRSPALVTGQQMYDLLGLLETPKDDRYMDYNVKVQKLDVEVMGLAYVASGKPTFDLSTLVRRLPQLHHMEIHHADHYAPFRPVRHSGRYHFNPQTLFQAMDETGIRLKTWRWARNLITSGSYTDLYGMMTAAHGRKMFAGMEKLVVCGFNVSNSPEEPIVDEEEDSHAQSRPGLANSIAKLPRIKDLTFITCDVLQSLQQLPTTLQRLELSNCLEITSDIMLAYFDTSASQMKELVLSHNAALSLSFLQGLKKGCPRLEVLKIDLHYYSEKLLTDDSEPLYDELLGADQVPTWPSSLRHLDILHAQKWQSEGAQNLFRSLIDSAPELPDLRHLAIHAHINIPWRDRVGFREQWIKRLRRVYLRKSEEPSKQMGSLKQFRMWKSDLQGKTLRGPWSERDELSMDFSDDDDHEIDPALIAHVKVSPRKPSRDTIQYGARAGERLSSSSDHLRRSQRVAETQTQQTSQESTPVSDSEDDVGKDDGRDEEPFVQGLCDVVDIRIDNQRPREEQYTEAHFLDSERSGDDDWHEGADEDGDEGYAW